jgi:hypothetical protein
VVLARPGDVRDVVMSSCIIAAGQHAADHVTC